MFLVTFLPVVSAGRTAGWDSQYIVTLFALALGAGAVFVVTELRSA